ncbi:hypothetical protein [Paucibacter sp. KCTC 42545]|uniref:hypothetical protein n=1 Tax=Paucibacter sp. KCTC 42545 TaxID=1768242 RepID=UPI0012E367E2
MLNGHEIHVPTLALDKAERPSTQALARAQTVRHHAEMTVRDTAGSNLSNQVDLKIVRDNLGHSNI